MRIKGLADPLNGLDKRPIKIYPKNNVQKFNIIVPEVWKITPGKYRKKGVVGTFSKNVLIAALFWNNILIGEQNQCPYCQVFVNRSKAQFVGPANRSALYI